MKYNLDTAIEITKAALFGAATGDALGVPVEFLPRKEVRAINLTEMLGCDTPKSFHSTFGDHIPAGTWSDDTSMAVAAMAAIAQDNGDIYFSNVMEEFVKWYDNGKHTPHGYAFDIGNTCAAAIQKSKKGVPAIICGPAGIRNNGNGALMRIFPFSLYCIFKGLDTQTTVWLINTASGITHGHGISKMGCLFFTLFMSALIGGHDCKAAWEYARTFDYRKWYSHTAIDAYTQLLSPDFINAKDSDINDSGYVVDSLNIAIYSMLNSTDYASAVLTSVNMGWDTDTFAAITGALAGVYYGYDSIPSRWLAKLRGKEMLERYAKDFSMAVNAT